MRRLAATRVCLAAFAITGLGTALSAIPIYLVLWTAITVSATLHGSPQPPPLALPSAGIMGLIVQGLIGWEVAGLALGLGLDALAG